MSTAAGARQDGVGLLRDPSFARVVAGQAVSSVGDQLFPVAVAVWMLTLRGDGPLALGAMFGARAAATSALLLVGGVFTDRLGPRTQLLGSLLLLAGTVGALALQPAHVPLAVLLVLFVLAGAGDAFFSPAYQTFLVQLAGPERLESANSIAALTRRVSGLFGPALAAGLVAGVGIRATLLIDACSFVVGAIAVASCRGLERTAAPGLVGERQPMLRSVLQEAREGLALTLRLRWLRAVLLSDLAQTFLAVAPFFVLLPVVLVPEGTGRYGVALSAFAAGGLLGAATPLKWRPTAVGRAALLTQALFALPLAALALELPFPLVVASAALGGYGVDLGAVLFTTGVQRGVPRAMLGRVMALSQIGSVALMPIGYALAGALARPLGVDVILGVGIAAIAISATAALSVPGVATMGADRNPFPEAARTGG